MKKLTFILFFLVGAKAISGQIEFQKQSSWFTPSIELKSSFKDEFSFIDDSLLIKKEQMSGILAPSLIGGWENGKISYQAGVEFFARFNFGTKWSLDCYNHLSYTNTSNAAYRASIQPKAFFTFGSIYNDLRTKINYKPSKFFHFQAGMDQFHLGEGERSLLLSSQGVSNPFLLLKSNFWKFEYLSLHQIWREPSGNSYVPKANSTHYLNFNHKNKISIGIFETVIHVIKDTLYNRGFEVEYLNPMIFYRPQEYSAGSSDNVILGLNGFIQLKNTTIYGQIALDDINIAEIKNRTKWWANKYGMLTGIKSIIKRWKNPVFFRTELSLISPYTYSATDIFTNYANQQLPKAHVLGSNFVESYTEILTKLGNYQLQLWLQYYVKGLDPSNQPYSYGGDIFKSYNTRPFEDYGYYLLMGDQNKVFQLGAKVERKITRMNLSIFAEPRCYYSSTPNSREIQAFITLGIYSGLLQQRRNY